jgi:hypothetical protein
LNEPHPEQVGPRAPTGGRSPRPAGTPPDDAPPRGRCP